jgi:RNA polymerase sigma-70 factor (ECF subfamily)
VDELTDESTDERLMEQLRRGQTGALDALYGRYASRLYTFCSYTARSLDPQEVEDVVQDVFMRVIQSAHTFRPQRASFRTWLFRIARNRCIDVMRRRQKVKMMPIGTSEERGDGEQELVPEGAIADEREDVEGIVVRASAIEAVRACIHELANEDERQALMLYYLGGKVYREIGQMLGRSTSTARNWIKSAQD